mgnify:CR=1 FL=1
MAVCKNIKSFSRHHERLADLFSLLALTLLFGSIWATLRYHQAVTLWLQDNWVLHSALLVAALVADVFLILAFLAILIWHMYSTVFSPEVYPMNPSWLTGKMPRKMFIHEHPEAEIEEVES